MPKGTLVFVADLPIQSLHTDSSRFITSRLVVRLSIAFRYPVPTHRRIQDGPVFSRPTVLLRLLRPISAVQSPYNHWFTHRLSPTGFILNVLDCYCYYLITPARIQVKTYPFSSILTVCVLSSPTGIETKSAVVSEVYDRKSQYNIHGIYF